jgi:hypothetical protein
MYQTIDLYGPEEELKRTTTFITRAALQVKPDD